VLEADGVGGAGLLLEQGALAQVRRRARGGAAQQHGAVGVAAVEAGALAEHAVDRGDRTLAAELGAGPEEGPRAAQARARVEHTPAWIRSGNTAAST
jgi:hypothetical protein